MSYQDYELDTPFGELCIKVEENCKDAQISAMNDLVDCIHSAKVQQSYLNDNGEVYALDVSFYYGQCYRELDVPVEDENDALDVIINSLMKELQEF